MDLSVAGAPGAGGPANLTPEQIEAFRQSMRDKFGKGRGQDGGAQNGKLSAVHWLSRPLVTPGLG